MVMFGEVDTMNVDSLKKKNDDESEARRAGKRTDEEGDDEWHEVECKKCAI